MKKSVMTRPMLLAELTDQRKTNQGMARQVWQSRRLLRSVSPNLVLPSGALQQFSENRGTQRKQYYMHPVYLSAQKAMLSASLARLGGTSTSS